MARASRRRYILAHARQLGRIQGLVVPLVSAGVLRTHLPRPPDTRPPANKAQFLQAVLRTALILPNIGCLPLQTSLTLFSLTSRCHSSAGMSNVFPNGRIDTPRPGWSRTTWRPAGSLSRPEWVRTSHSSKSKKPLVGMTIPLCFFAQIIRSVPERGAYHNYINFDRHFVIRVPTHSTDHYQGHS